MGRTLAADLRQVAQRSGVSVSTASRALNGSSRVSGDTRAKVRAAASALGYRPNASARALRTARSQFIGLVVTNLVNASFHTIAEVVQREFARHGYQLMLSVTGGDPVPSAPRCTRWLTTPLLGSSSSAPTARQPTSCASWACRRCTSPAARGARPATACSATRSLAGGTATEYLLGSRASPDRDHRRPARRAVRCRSGCRVLAGHAGSWPADQQCADPADRAEPG